MEDVDVRHAKEHLEELIARARQGEVVRIVDPELGSVRVVPDPPAVRPKRISGQWKGMIEVPIRLMEPLSDEELRWLSGEASA